LWRFVALAIPKSDRATVDGDERVVGRDVAVHDAHRMAVEPTFSCAWWRPAAALITMLTACSSGMICFPPGASS
jgi:hypothetical protein